MQHKPKQLSFPLSTEEGPRLDERIASELIEAFAELLLEVAKASNKNAAGGDDEQQGH